MAAISPYFDYEIELTKSIKEKEQENMSRRMAEIEEDEIDELLGKYHFSAGASREIKKSLIHEPKKSSGKKAESPDDLQDELGITEGVPAEESNKSAEYYDDEGSKDNDWKRARKAQARAEAKKGAEPEDTNERYGTAEKSFSLSGNFRQDKRGLREILEKAAWGQKERAAERLAELDLVKSESGLRYLAGMLDADWFE